MNLVGARPQFIKAAAFTQALRTEGKDRMEEILVHSGQHYDPGMSGVFFRELGLPAPRYHLGVGSGTHAHQTAKVIEAMAAVLEKEQPDVLVVYGDTNTTLAGALAASKLGIPVAHVEAGLRSFNSAMPEEVNRRLTDHMSTWLFCPTQPAVELLAREGIQHTEGASSPDHPKVIMTGDIMVDVAHIFGDKALQEHSAVTDEKYVLFTLHRDFNTDNPERLRNILNGVIRLAQEVPVYFTVHPRTAARIPHDLNSELGRTKCVMLEPLPYLEMIAMEKRASLIITDSGGVQKEGFFFGKPVVIPRPQTEWHQIVEKGCAYLSDDDGEALYTQCMKWLATPPVDFPNLYGDGDSAKHMVRILLEDLSK